MNKYIFFMLLWLSAIPLAAQKTGVIFHDLTFGKALQEAGKQGKLVFLDCYTKTCGPCKYIKEKVFPLQEVGEYMNPRYVSIMRDMEEGEGPELGKRYGVGVYPTFLVLDSEGKEIFRMFASLNPKKEFLMYLKLNEKVAGERNAYRAGERGQAFLKEYFRDLKNLKTREYVQTLSSFLYEEKRDSLFDKIYWQAFKDEIHNIELPVFRYMLKNRKKLTKIYGQEEVYGKLFGEYATEFRTSRMMGLDYDVRIADMKLFEKEGHEEATPLLWRMRIYRLWNGGKGGKGSITGLLGSLEKVLPEFSATEKMSIAEDFAPLSEVATPAERKAMLRVLDRLGNGQNESRLNKRLQELRSYITQQGL